MNDNQIKLIRRKRNNAPVLQKRIKELTLERREKPVTLQRRKKPDVFWCANKKIKNRLPTAIECNWIGEMYKCCRECTRKTNYSFWKRGTYDGIRQELKEKTYRPGCAEETNVLAFIAKEEEGD